MFQPVCSSWIWMNRATSKRSPNLRRPNESQLCKVRSPTAGKDCPLGDCTNITVQNANCMISRTHCLLFVCFGGASALLNAVQDILCPDAPAVLGRSLSF